MLGTNAQVMTELGDLPLLLWFVFQLWSFHLCRKRTETRRRKRRRAKRRTRRWLMVISSRQWAQARQPTASSAIRLSTTRRRTIALVSSFVFFFFFYAFFPLQWSGLLLLSSNQLSVLWSIIEIIVDLREKGSGSEICPKMITSSDKEVASTFWRGSVRTFEPCDYDTMYIIDKIVFIYFIYLSAAHNIESRF